MTTATAPAKKKTATKSQAVEVLSDSVDIIDRVNRDYVQIQKACYAVVEVMVEQGRSIPNSQERGCFRAGDWLAKSPSGKPFWQIQLAIEERRSRIRESLDTPAERKAEVDALQAAKSTLAKEAPALESEIAKLTATLNKLQQAVTEAQATVDWRAEKIELAKSPTLLPSYLDGEASRVRALIKQSAALEKWWTMQAFCDGCPGLLAKDPESKTDCAAIVNHIREHCPEAIIDLANQSFDHVRIGEWFDEMRTKLAKWKPIVDAGRAKLAEDLAVAKSEAENWFIRDHDARIAAKSESGPSSKVESATSTKSESGPSEKSDF